MAIRVAIPCRRFNVRAHLGYTEGLSQFEQFALRTLAARSSTARELAEILGLEERMALDLCVELVTAGLAELHLDSGKLEPTALVREKLGDPSNPPPGWALVFASERSPESEEIELLQEMVSGAVFPAPRWTSSSVRDLLAPEKHAVPPIETIEHAILAAAAARGLETLRARRSERAKEGSTDEALPGLRVVDVSLSTAQRVQGASDANGWRERIQVEVEVVLDEDDEIRDIWVVEPRGIPRSVRRAIGRGLLELQVSGLRDEEGQFFDLLRERARSAEPLAGEVKVSDDWNPLRRVDALQEGVEDLTSSEWKLEELPGHHEQLLGLWESAYDEVLEAASRTAYIDLVQGTAAHQVLVIEALRTARDQIVLATPWMGQLDTNQEFRDAMTDAVSRGIRIHLVWGINPEEQRRDWPKGVEELCSALNPRGSGTGGIFVSDWAAGIHAKLIVKDFEWMLVSSCNFLNSPRDRTAIELGVRVSLNAGPEEAREAGSALTRTIRDAGPLPMTLGWIRSVVPDFAVRRAMIVDPVLGGIARLPPSIELQREFPAPDSELARRIWSDWWRRRTDDLRSYLARVGTYVVPVFDLGHRGLLFEALETAQRRVVVSSDKLGVGLLGRVPFDATAAARARGVEVTVIFAESMSGQSFEARRSELEALGVSFIRRDIHAKALVADDRVCISSFNFLSFEGIGKAGRVRRELGVRVFEEGFADRVVEALLAHS